MVLGLAYCWVDYHNIPLLAFKTNTPPSIWGLTWLTGVKGLFSAVAAVMLECFLWGSAAVGQVCYSAMKTEPARHLLKNWGVFSWKSPWIVGLILHTLTMDPIRSYVCAGAAGLGHWSCVVLLPSWDCLLCNVFMNHTWLCKASKAELVKHSLTVHLGLVCAEDFS